MRYADYEYYVMSYLVGTDPEIAEMDYDFFAKQAEREIDKYTFGRIRADQSLLTDEVRECSCAVAEALYAAHSAAQRASEQGLAGTLVSWSNDGESGSVDLSESVCTEGGKNRKIRNLICTYLGNTGLLYAGV